MRRLIALCLPRLRAPTAITTAFLTLLATTAWAVPDPDVDPASELAANAWAEVADVEILGISAHLHETADTGLPYVRVEVELANSGSEPLYAVDWQIQIDDIELTISPNELIQPGETKRISQLVLGTLVQGLHPGSAVSVGMVARQSKSETLCANAPTQAQCAVVRSAMNERCVQKCIGEGGHGGRAECMASEHVDRNGVRCEFWTPICICEGRPSLTESLDAGLIDLNDPRTGGPVIYPPLLETRPFERP